MNTFKHTVTSHQSASHITALGDAETLRKIAVHSVAINFCVQQKPVKVLSNCCSFIKFKDASSAQLASVVGLQHKIAGQLVTVQPVRLNLQDTHIRYSFR